MKTLWLKLLTVVLLIFALKCTTTPERQAVNMTGSQQIKPPIANVDVAFQNQNIDATKVQTLNYADGTSINIPADAFVDENGQPVKEVQFQYRSIKTPGEIIASGVPMSYDSAGVRYNFQTAGMFEIQAFSNGKKVMLKNGKALNVNMASNQDGDYNFYQFDQKSGAWNYQGNAPKQINEARKSLLAKLPKQVRKPVEPMKFYADKDKVLDLDVDYAQFADLKEYKGILWKCADTDNRKIADSLLKHAWTKTNLEASNIEKNIYKITLESKGRKGEFLVSPVLTGRNYTKALTIYTSQMREYENIQKEIARAEAQAEFSRNYAVRTMGLCNWDCVYRDPQLVWINAKYEIDALKNIVNNSIELFHVSGENVIVKYTTQSLDKFSFNPNRKNTLFAILPENRVAVFTNEDFKKISPSTNPNKSADYTFAMKVADKPVSDVQNIDDILKQVQ